MRKILISIAVVVLASLPACGSVSGPIGATGAEEQTTETQTADIPTTDTPTTDEPTTDAPTRDTPTTDSPDPGPEETTRPPEEQQPADATSIDGTMSVELPSDWRYAPEIETAYSVFAWTKIDGSQNLSMAPLGPWTQITTPEEYLEELQAAGNLGDATVTLEGDYSVDGYDGFWMTVEGPGYVANIYYINVNGGIKEITGNAFHSQGLEEIDRLVQTIDFH